MDNIITVICIIISILLFCKGAVLALSDLFVPGMIFMSASIAIAMIIIFYRTENK